jgi:hypothetical protein
MAKVIQEKFQVTYADYNSMGEEDIQGWTDDQSMRAKKGLPGREGAPGGDGNSRWSMNAVMLNSLPPGMDIEDQEIVDVRQMGINTVGNMGDALAQGDLTNMEVNAYSLRKGFDKKELLQTDDAYTREHNDAFYDDVGGFVERNNYLDRM